MTAARLAALACTFLVMGAADAHAAWPTAVNSQITSAPSDSTPLTTVNGQITDVVTQTNVKVLGDPPAMAMGQLFTTAASSIAVANAPAAAPTQNVDDQETTTQSVQTLYAVDTASDPAQIAWILRTGCSTYLTAQLYAWCAARTAG